MPLAPVQTLEETAVFQLLAQANERRLPASVRQGLLDLGPAAVPDLVAVVTDDRFVPCDAPGDGWAPGHAARLLGELKAVEAIEPMVRTLATSDPDGWLRDSLACALGDMGPAVVEPVLRAHDASDDDDLRDWYCGVLADVGVRDERVYERLLRHLERNPQLGPGNLAKYGDARAIPRLVDLFDRLEASLEPTLLVNQDFVEVEDAITHLGGALTPAQAEKFARAMRGREEVQALFAAPPRATPARAAPRPGRNDPCPCGSGRKLKKCHPD